MQISFLVKGKFIFLLPSGLPSMVPDMTRLSLQMSGSDGYAKYLLRASRIRMILFVNLQQKLVPQDGSQCTVRCGPLCDGK